MLDGRGFLPVLGSILILGSLGLSENAFAQDLQNLNLIKTDALFADDSIFTGEPVPFNDYTWFLEGNTAPGTFNTEIDRLLIYDNDPLGQGECVGEAQVFLGGSIEFFSFESMRGADFCLYDSQLEQLTLTITPLDINGVPVLSPFDLINNLAFIGHVELVTPSTQLSVQNAALPIPIEWIIPDGVIIPASPDSGVRVTMHHASTDLFEVIFPGDQPPLPTSTVIPADALFNANFQHGGIELFNLFTIQGFVVPGDVFDYSGVAASEIPLEFFTCDKGIPGDCPIPDKDGDGVSDDDDLCPGTPPGTPVDADGCALGDMETVIDSDTTITILEINQDETVTIQIDVTLTITDGIDCSGGSIENNGGTIVLDPNTNSNFDDCDYISNGDGSLEMEENSSLNAIGTSTFTLQDGSTINLNDGATLTTNDDGSLTVNNGATLNLNNGATLTLNNGATLTFNDDGSLTADTSSSVTFDELGEGILNDNSIITLKNGGTLTLNDDAKVTINDNGSIGVESSDVILNNDSLLTGFGGSLTIDEDSTLTIPEDSTLGIGGQFVLNNDGSITVSGRGELRASGDAVIMATGRSTIFADGDAKVTVSRFATVLASGDSEITASGNTRIDVTEDAKVTATGNAEIFAKGDSQINVSDNAQVRAEDNVRIIATGSARVTAEDNAVVTASGSAEIRVEDNVRVTVSGNANVRAFDNAIITASGSADVVAFDNAIVTATGDGQIIAKDDSHINLSGSATLFANDNARVIATGNGRISAADNSEINVSGSSAVVARENARVIATGNGVIFVGDDSEINVSGSSVVVASDNAEVTSTGNGRILARDNSEINVSGSARVSASGNAEVNVSGSGRVSARENAEVNASGDARISIFDDAQFTVSENARVRVFDDSKITVTGNGMILGLDFSKVTVSGNSGVILDDNAEATFTENSEYNFIELGIMNIINGIVNIFSSDSLNNDSTITNFDTVNIHGTYNNNGITENFGTYNLFGVLNNPGIFKNHCGATFNDNGGTITGNQIVDACDTDGDGIADSIDTIPDTFSNSFEDSATTSGIITSRGGQTVSISDEPDPDGVLVFATGAGAPATVSACGDAGEFSFESGDLAVLTCSSVSITVVFGSVFASFNTGGIPGTITLTGGESVIFDPDTLLVTAAPGTSGEIMVGDLIIPLPDGGTIEIPLIQDDTPPPDDGQVVGGRIIPIETTSLLLAGAQTFSWMIPVVLSVLGIGLFVVSRKSE